ncbi:MAG: putative transport system permease protein, partial [Actinomycetota bacterium]|nr:putative transport system permease protein [Actinomycetota bacterium]
VAVNEATVDRAHVDVGDVLHLVTLTPAQRLGLIAGDSHAFDSGPLGPELDVRIVGVLRGVSDVAGRSNPAIYATTAFDHAYRGRIAHSARAMLVQRAPGVSAEQFHAAADRIVGNTTLGVFDAATEDAPVQHTLATLTGGLVVFAALAALVSVLVVSLAVGRHVAGTEADQAILATLGLTRWQRGVAAVLTVAPVAALGMLVAGGGCLLASPLMPVGLARRVDPDLGLRLDLIVVAMLALTVVLVVGAAAVIAAVAVTRVASPRRRMRHRSAVPARLASIGAPPVVTVGVGFAVDRGRPSLPVRSAFAGVAGAVIVIVAAVTFASSLDRLAAEPARWGFGWDLMLDAATSTIDHDAHTLSSDTELDAVSLLSTNYTFAAGDGIRSYGLAPLRGSIGYALVNGAQPTGADEMVVGPDTARRSHLRIGSVLDVAVCPCSGDPATAVVMPVRVVGIALFPEDDDGNFTDALGFSGEGFARHVGDDSAPRWAVRIAEGHTQATVASHLSSQFPGQFSQYSYPTRPGDVENLNGLRSFAPLLAGFTALLGVAALANVLVTTLRRRRVELAVLRSIGLTPRQTGRCVMWQSFTVALSALVVGAPIGVLAGARVWSAVAGGIGVATNASHPSTLLLVPIGAVVLATIVTAPIASRVAHIRPGDALRAR